MDTNLRETVETLGDEVNEESAGRGRSDNLAIRKLRNQGKLIRYIINIKLDSSGLSQPRHN